LRAVGRWLKVNGEAIYGAGRTPFGEEFGAFSKTQPDNKARLGKEWRCEVCGAVQKRPPAFEPRQDWRCTTKPGKLYIHIFDWPEGGKFQLPAAKRKVVKAYLLADPKHTELKVIQTDAGVSIALPSAAPDPIASVVCLEMQGQ
jgi:alpha-L-fucosidase